MGKQFTASPDCRRKALGDQDDLGVVHQYLANIVNPTHDFGWYPPDARLASDLLYHDLP